MVAPDYKVTTERYSDDDAKRISPQHYCRGWAWLKSRIRLSMKNSACWKSGLKTLAVHPASVDRSKALGSTACDDLFHDHSPTLRVFGLRYLNWNACTPMYWTYDAIL